MWIIQEVVVTTSASILCGQDIMPWNEFAASILYIGSSLNPEFTSGLRLMVKNYIHLCGILL
jgi:hypothetical protein